MNIKRILIYAARKFPFGVLTAAFCYVISIEQPTDNDIGLVIQ